MSSASDLRLSVTSEEAPNFSKETFLLVFSPFRLTFPPGRDDVPSQGGEEDTSCCFRYLSCPGWSVSTDFPCLHIIAQLSFTIPAVD